MCNHVHMFFFISVFSFGKGGPQQTLGKKGQLNFCQDTQQPGIRSHHCHFHSLTQTSLGFWRSSLLTVNMPLPNNLSQCHPRDLFVCFSKQCFSVEPWMSWNLLCKPGQPQTQRCACFFFLALILFLVFPSLQAREPAVLQSGWRLQNAWCQECMSNIIMRQPATHSLRGAGRGISQQQ